MRERQIIISTIINPQIKIYIILISDLLDLLNLGREVGSKTALNLQLS